MNQKKAPNPASMLVYVGILLFVLFYDKYASGDVTKDSIIAIIVAGAVFVIFALLRLLKNRN